MKSQSTEKLTPRGDVIALRREEIGLSQQQLAKAVAVSQTTINRVESGSAFPIGLMNKIATALSIPLKEIVVTLEYLGTEHSRIFLAKKAIMKGIATREIPTGGRILTSNKERLDIRDFVETEWDNADFTALELTPDENDQLWLSLINDGVIEYREDGHFAVLPSVEEFEHIVFLDYGNLIGMTSMALRLPRTQRARLSESLKTIRDESSLCTVYDGERLSLLMQRFVLALCKSHRYLLDITDKLQATTRLIFLTVVVFVDILEGEELEKYLEEMEDMYARIVRMQTRIIDLIDDPTSHHDLCMQVMGDDSHPIMAWVASVVPILNPLLT